MESESWRKLCGGEKECFPVAMSLSHRLFFPCRVEHVNGVVKHQLFIVIL